MDGQGTKRRKNIAENFNRLSRAHKRHRRQTDDRRQTDGQRHIANLNLSSRSLKIGRFQKPEVVISYPWIEISRLNLIPK